MRGGVKKESAARFCGPPHWFFKMSNHFSTLFAVFQRSFAQAAPGQSLIYSRTR